MRAVDTALDVTSSGTPVHCSVSGNVSAPAAEQLGDCEAA